MNLTITEKRSQQGYGRHNRFALILLVLAAVWFGAPTLPAEAVDFDQHQVNFLGVQYDDPATGQSTWFYEVKGGPLGGPNNPDISHVTFAISTCATILDAGKWAGPTGFDTRYSGAGSPTPTPPYPKSPATDPTTGITGLKFDEGLQKNQTAYYYFTLDGNYQTDKVNMAVKAGPNEYYNQVELPSPDCTRVGAIGDRVWLDRNADGVQDANEPGIQGVPVQLFDSSNTLIAEAVTGDDGFYLFKYLPVGTYTVKVTPPPGMTQTYDADGLGTPDQSMETITSGEVNLEQDFGYWFGDPEDEVRLDLGDLPQEISGLPDYPTFFVSGAAHVVFPDTDNNGTPNSADGRPAIWLGEGISVEPDGQPDALAAGDDLDDGLSFAATGWNPGGSSTMTVSLNSDPGTTAYFGIWIDWTLDGVFDAFYSGSGTAPGNIDVLIAVPDDYANTNVYIRVRAHDAPLGAADYQGTLVNGEVEDYIVRFSPTAVTLTSITATTQASMPLLAIILLTALVLFSTSVLIQRRQAVAVN